ncbi:cystatin-13-like [Prionailurus viverrinus]|uniref:cystatin-13-like n=1 Tax=Prionailurus viverrinus TaxID=61388 RepID=UPI001FF0E657|nr:cystatin-13-like [Prionailurus viverrinus]XP_047709427.1 cystatin-13-like [Prionailurus viverrinus]
MGRLCQSLLLLVATVALVSGSVHAWGRPKVVRKFQDIPETYVYVQQALWFAMKEFNKISKDKYSYKVVKVLKSQEQVTESLDYFLEVKIARTMCKKISGENENCLLQQDPQMQKMFYCTFIVATKPWKFEFTMLKKQCKEV